jgi:hypothetical protein
VVDVDASVWEDADITPTTTQEEEEEEYKDETEAELTQTLEEVSYMFARYQCCGSASFWQAGSGFGSATKCHGFATLEQTFVALSCLSTGVP